MAVADAELTLKLRIGAEDRRKAAFAGCSDDGGRIWS